MLWCSWFLTSKYEEVSTTDAFPFWVLCHDPPLCCMMPPSKSKLIVPYHPTLLLDQKLILIQDSGGGASGRAMAFCPCEPGSNPMTDLGFWIGCWLNRLWEKFGLILSWLLGPFWAVLGRFGLLRAVWPFGQFWIWPSISHLPEDFLSCPGVRNWGQKSGGRESEESDSFLEPLYLESLSLWWKWVQILLLSS